MARSRRKPSSNPVGKPINNHTVKRKKKEQKKKRRNNVINKKAKKKENLENRLVLIGISIVILTLSVVVGLGSQSLKKKDHEYRLREEKLIEQIKSEEIRAEQLEHKRIYVQTKQYIEQVAKEKLGLVKPGEIIIKPKGNEDD